MRSWLSHKLFAPPEYAASPRHSLRFLVWLALLSLSLVLLAEALRLPGKTDVSKEELEAVRIMKEASATLKEHRLRMEQAAVREAGPGSAPAADLGINTDLDPNATGLIGVDYSDITTTVGSLKAKRTSTNPAFAGILVRMLRQAGCSGNDRVALTMTGSFPALNIASLAACKALGLRPRFVSSVGSSNFGANIPGFTWLDMEKHLHERGVFPWLSATVSLGGVAEGEGGIDGMGFKYALDAVTRHGAPLLEEGDYREITRWIGQRKKVLDAEGPVKCYINVGGGLTALGWVAESSRLDNGLLRAVPALDDPARGLIFLYLEEGVPVIHLLNIERLAERYALPADPIPMPAAEDALEGGAYLRRFVQGAAVLLLWAVFALVLLWREAGWR
jgi:poly-gamma-glutamate system protein